MRSMSSSVSGICKVEKSEVVVLSVGQRKDHQCGMICLSGLQVAEATLECAWYGAGEEKPQRL